MKYIITHCYTDKNKGDAAIIIATTQLIKEIDNNADISFISTYGSKDYRVEKEHELIKNYGNRILPSIFGEPLPLFGIKNDKLRIISFFLDLIKSMLLLISSNDKFIKLFLNKKERESFKFFYLADVIISKGGSYLCTENTSLRQTFSLIRMLYPFILAKRYKKKIVIFSQSLGPVEGRINGWLFKKILSNIDSIFLRESLCFDKYKIVKDVCKKVDFKIIPDSAFFLKNEKSENIPLDIDISKYNIGYTIVDHDFKYIDDEIEKSKKRENYIQSIRESIKYFIDNFNAIIHIFPQVLVDISHTGHNDMKISKEISDSFIGTKYENCIYFYNKDFSPIQLRNLYSQMEFLIGTRLHSVIFTLSTETPAINISYHGTKSLGILKGIKNYAQYVVDINTIEPKILLEVIKKMIENKKDIKETLKIDIMRMKNELHEAMREVCSI
ncbi:polysaccharide pyruvyl transferase family protein [Aliarcobacter cryaerophilus]|uniref:polysaccharide pyruvyl transferase family protein n=1 Tax=Aliarcobacter cryaerophilus TaxID=28198 RepID=UPI003DA1DF56